MTIYQIRRDSNTWQVIDKKELEDGYHLISHGGVSIPIQVKENRIIFDIQKAEGNLFSAELPTLGGREGFTLDGGKNSSSIMVELKEGEVGLHIYRDRNDTNLLIERGFSGERL